MLKFCPAKVLFYLTTIDDPLHVTYITVLHYWETLAEKETSGYAFMPRVLTYNKLLCLFANIELMKKKKTYQELKKFKLEFRISFGGEI